MGGAPGARPVRGGQEGGPGDHLHRRLRTPSGAAGGLGFGGANQEQEQTPNQILTMDGVDARQAVIVVAPTNRPDVLDPALLRPGRFDRRVTVQRPDRAGRERILRVHTRGAPALTSTWGALAGATPGLVGRSLRNLVNEAP